MTTPATIPSTEAAAKNPLLGLLTYGQSPWLDYIRRDILLNGELKRMIAEDGLRGMTSNPSIFEKAITGSDEYQDILHSPDTKHLDANQIYERIALRDLRDAADIFRPVFQATNGSDGFVSLEVSPILAMDTKATIDEARRLWSALDRPNVMIKVPGTAQGLPAIRQLLEDGLNINITLLFGVPVYKQVLEAYLAALEARASRGQDISKISSVASFFVSRIDTLVDSKLEQKRKTVTDPKQLEALAALEGKVAIANAKIAYEHYQGVSDSPRWKALAAKGARPQRLLWASTSTKNKKYRDVLYIEELIGAETVDTIPPATFDAFRNHGKLRNSLTENVAGAHATMDALAGAGISITEVTDALVADGVRLFAEAFKQLLDAASKGAGVRA
jgi:transaldolase